jgi:predicted RNA-binding protein YlxR (DUF448 family)
MQVRTCVGCGQHGSRTDLLRIVHFQGDLIIDSDKLKPGRGSWIHPKNQCFSTAIQRSSFARALRVRVNLQAISNLKEQAEKMFEN